MRFSRMEYFPSFLNPPWTPLAALALNASAVGFAIEKQRTSVKSRTEVLWVGERTNEKIKWWPLFCLKFMFTLPPQAHCNELKNKIKADSSNLDDKAAEIVEKVIANSI